MRVIATGILETAEHVQKARRPEAISRNECITSSDNKLHTCAESVQFYLTKKLIINTKLYDFKMVCNCAIRYE